MYDFVFKPFEEMTDEDYARVGFMSGLEIHQQLFTEKKLFCRCPAGMYSTKYDAEILRHMRPTLSELGEYDGTALMEFKTKKNILYRINRKTVCTYEMDDTPPFLINDQALDIAIEIGLLLDCKIVNEMHIIRKQYLDGSIPTGFQRTAIFAVDGKIPYKDREIEIIQLSIEEDSCREISDVGHNRIYNTDRLGMPLIETVTGPDMKTPQEVADVASICAKLSRSTGKVRRGIGAAREDVNVSVKGGTRVEIKGVPQITQIPILTYNEAMRQWNLLRLREELKKRGITEQTFEANTHDITRVVKKTHYQPISQAVSSGLVVKSVVLKGFKKLLNWRTQTDTFFSREISDRVRVIACLTSLPNIVHSDSKGDSLSSAEWKKIKKYVDAGENDTVVLVWGNEADTTMAANEIEIRAKEATIGVPSETRQALHDGTNGFERILPGPSRMYPDTDLPPEELTRERVTNINSDIPEKFWVNEEWYKELRIPIDTIEPLSISRFAKTFKTAVTDYKINPVFAAVALTQFIKRLKKQGFDTEKLSADKMLELFKALSEQKTVKDSVYYLMQKIILNPNLEIKHLPPPATDEELKAVLSQAEMEVTKISLIENTNKSKLVTGKVMNQLRSRIDGNDVSKLIKENVAEGV
ncbi:MAG: Glu-tRNA(Gln) amidotransferase subunit GatE [Rhodothermaceae bacterium]